MLVKYWMSAPAVTVEAGDPLAEAGRRMDRHGIRMLPVLEEGRLTGVITRAAAAGAVPGDRVRRAMIRDPVRIPLYHTVEEAAVALLERGVRAAPVTDPAGGVAGVVSAKDLFRTLGMMIGVHRKGLQVALRAANRPGAVQEVAELVGRHCGRIGSLLTRGGTSGDESLEIHLRILALEPAARARLKSELHTQARVVYVVDHDSAERQIVAETPCGPAAAPNPERSGRAIEKGGNR